MTPTPKLRWINRPIPNSTLHLERVLQQWWEKKEWAHDTEIVVDSEWRDVPLEKNT
jgi:hypothetical protein